MKASPLSRLQVMAAAILFSSGGAAIKACSLTGWQVAGFRSGVAAVSVLILLPTARRHWSWRAALVGVFYASTLISFVAANKLTTAASTIFLQSTAPLYILLLAPWLLREHLRTRDLLFLAAMAIGLCMLLFAGAAPAPTAPDPHLGNLIAAGSGLFYGATLIGLRWLGRATHDGEGSAVPAVLFGNLIAFAACLPMALPVTSARPLDWLLIVGLGTIQIALAYAFLTAGIRHVPALEASLLLLLEPVLNPVWAWLVQGETPGHWSLAGGAIVLVSTVLKASLDSTKA